jgi:putative restriction endonuclease
MNVQNYEEYWSLTNAFTDYKGDRFLTTLKICIEFIDEFKTEIYSPDKYLRLQHQILKAVPKSAQKIEDQLFSTRKAINLLVKLGFINSFLVSYQKESIEYLSATIRKKKTLLSKIVYSYSSFNKSVKKDSKLHQMNFLINTMVEVGSLKKEDIIALMLVNIEQVEKGYLTRDELDQFVIKAKEIDFIERKYNQISYLTNLLRKLDDIVFIKNELYFTEDAKQIFGENLEIVTRKRNPYLHLIYKNQLKEESFSVFESEKCMVEKISHPTLIASHIKPFAVSSEFEAYDPNNGFLLSRNIDALFDLGYITFENDGNILFSEKLSNDVIESVSIYKLESLFLNENRLEYLKFHRDEVFNKRFKFA